MKEKFLVNGPSTSGGLAVTRLCGLTREQAEVLLAIEGWTVDNLEARWAVDITRPHRRNRRVAVYHAGHGIGHEWSLIVVARED